MSVWDRSKNVADDTKDEPKEEQKSRPVRRKVLHKECQTISTLGVERAESFAKDPDFDSELYCAHCKTRAPVSEFSWRA